MWLLAPILALKLLVTLTQFIVDPAMFFIDVCDSKTRIMETVLRLPEDRGDLKPAMIVVARLAGREIPTVPRWHPMIAPGRLGTRDRVWDDMCRSGQLRKS